MPKDKLLITGGTGSFGNAYLNKAISQNVTFAANENGSTTGPITVNTGVTLTIGTGGTVVII